MDKKRVVLVTTTLAKYDTKYHKVRASLTLQMIRFARRTGYHIIAVDGGSPPEYIKTMESLGAVVYPEALPGMGKCRRQAFQAGIDYQHGGKSMEAIVWLEPEKSTLIKLLERPLKILFEMRLDLVMLGRESLTSYPPEQAHYYEMARLAFTYLSGRTFDYPFGPLIVTPTGAQFFVNYQSKSGDLWDSIQIPKLRILEAGLRASEVTIDYTNPKIQTRAETGNMELFKRRIAQLQNLIESVQLEMSQI